MDKIPASGFMPVSGHGAANPVTNAFCLQTALHRAERLNVKLSKKVKIKRFVQTAEISVFTSRKMPRSIPEKLPEKYRIEIICCGFTVKNPLRQQRTVIGCGLRRQIFRQIV